MTKKFTVDQGLFKQSFPPISITTVDERVLEKEILLSFLPTDSSEERVGVSAIYGKRCAITSIAFATLTSSLVVHFSKRHGRRALELIKDCILDNSRYTKYAFKMDTFALSLFTDLSLRISNAVDLLSLKPKGNRHSLERVLGVMGGEHMLHKQNVKVLFFKNAKEMSHSDVAMQAWAACTVAILYNTTSVPRIDTLKLTQKELASLARIARDGDLLESIKPTFTRNDVRPDFSVKGDRVNLTCERFRTRIRPSGSQFLLIETKSGTSKNSVAGRTTQVQGRKVQVSVDGPVRGEIVSVSTIGKDDMNFAETARQVTILHTLQRRTSILSQPFFQRIWLPHERTSWPKQGHSTLEPSVYFPRRTLNPSQEMAVEKILSSDDDNRVVMIHGPPGTGKTTVIAAAVTSFHHANRRRSVWIAAQSNVAVKNIAEKFCDVGFYDFKLLVSRDFHFDWHEHLYKDILEPHFIRSDAFSEDIVGAARQLLDARVILCTLTMLSNPSIAAYTHIAPVHTIMFDEASQIEVGDYIPVIHRFSSTLRKFVFIGDNKQLAPYGQEEVCGLRSVFEFDHLLKNAVFLDIQYRLPCAIGDFISENIYLGKLTSFHDITDRKACRFIDVKGGNEAKQGHSWVNRGEAMIVCRIARLYQDRNKPYRIITPYDAQRTVIEIGLKSANLNWENKVFNVDSFQGNEGDHIIVSVVRSRNIGFLQNERRTNVMLTRCKKSMIICTSRAFMSSPQVSGTLIGRLAASLGPGAWIERRNVLNGNLS